MKTFGRAAGAVGVLLLVFTAPFSFLTANSVLPSIIALALGVGLIAVWAMNRDRSGSLVRSAFFYSSSFGLTLAFLGVLVAVNFIAARRSPTWDLTSKKIFSLSAQTETALKGLDRPVKALAFTRGDTPPQVEDLFRKYAALSPNFTYEFVDPRRNPDLTRAYQVREGQPAAVLVSGSGEKEMHQIVNLTRLMNPLIAEQELTNGLVKLQTVGTQKLYFITGHGEIPLSPPVQTAEGASASMAELKRILEDEGSAPTELSLVQAPEVPGDASAVILAGARNSLSPHEVELLTRYVAEGGRLLIFHEYGSQPALPELMDSFGLQLEPGLVADAKVNASDPYQVFTPFYGEHEAVTPLTVQQAIVYFDTTMALTKLTTSDAKVTPLVLTTPYAWVDTVLSNAPQQDSNERTGQLILAAVSTRPTDPNIPGRRSVESRLIVFGDAQLLWMNLGKAFNRDLVLNTIAWATLQTRRITIRPPDRDLSSVDLSAEVMSHIRLFSVVLLPSLLLAVGLTIWNTRRSR
ncbi:MAG: GldG family protein [Myxococcaceae bacterium]